jgi:hypothetical protein
MSVLFLSALSMLTVGGLAMGCGSSSSSPGDGGIDNARTISSLSDAEIGAFCDQLAAIEGGYSKTKSLSCSDDAGVTISTDVTFNIGANQGECKTRFKTQLPAACGSLTVDTIKTCVADTYAQTCSSPDNGPASCASFFACAG